MKALEFQSVCKSFGSVEAIKELNFSIEKGECVALLGSNGAGKSTFINLAAGIRRPDRGKISIYGSSPGSLESKQHMRILTQELSFPSQLKVKEVLALVAGHYNSFDFSRFVASLDIEHLLSRNIQGLSGGEKKRVGIICTLIGSPELILLDEPTSNIDLRGRHLVYETLKEFLKEKKRSLIFSSHQMQEVEFLADKIFILKRGEIATSGTTAEVKSRFGLKKVSYRSQRSDISIAAAKKKIAEGDRFSLLGRNSDEMLKELLAKDSGVFDVTIAEPSLDEIFMKIWDEGEGQ